MRMYDLIMKKRNGSALSDEEIRFMVQGYTKGDIPDYQMSAMMMAVYFRGMDADETLALTMAMAESGDMLDLGEIRGVKNVIYQKDTLLQARDKRNNQPLGRGLTLYPVAGMVWVKKKGSARGVGEAGPLIANQIEINKMLARHRKS